MRRCLILLGIVMACAAFSPRAGAQGTSPYIGQILIVPYEFAPVGWAFCDGSILSIAEFPALFDLIGTTYGGDGKSTFALPDLRGRVPIGQGQGPGTSDYVIGQAGGEETVTLTVAQIPAHTHEVQGQGGLGTTNNPSGATWATQSRLNVYSSATPSVTMGAASIGTAGSSEPHDNHSPYLTINYIISLFGVFPSQS